MDLIQNRGKWMLTTIMSSFMSSFMSTTLLQTIQAFHDLEDDFQGPRICLKLTHGHDLREILPDNDLRINSHSRHGRGAGCILGMLHHNDPTVT